MNEHQLIKYSALTAANVIWETLLLYGEPYTFLSLLTDVKFVPQRRQGKQDYICICFSIFSDLTKQSQTDRWLCCLLSHSQTWMNIKATTQKRWNLIMCHVYGFWVTEEKRWYTFRGIIALVNNSGLPVLHSITGRTGSRPFHHTEINKRTVEPEETHIPGKWVLYEED